MRLLLVVPLVLTVGCVEREPLPGEVGFYDCDAFPLGAGQIRCDPVQLCCEQVTPADQQCAIVREDTKEYRCRSELDCYAAVEEAVCDVCDVDRDALNCDGPSGQPGVRP